MTKKELRQLYKQKRTALSVTEREMMSLQIAQQLSICDIWGYNFYHLFLSIKELNEVDTTPILQLLYQKNKQVVVPKMNSEKRTLTSIPFTKDTLLQTNNWGVPEPKDGIAISAHKIEVVFVPLLAYDLYGNRIGYGGGYYDRFLAECRPETLKIGLSFFLPEENFSSISLPTDVRLTHIVTPEKIITIKSLSVVFDL